ncbi:hypothetical protein Peur_044667 [Populus x canadensis]
MQLQRRVCFTLRISAPLIPIVMSFSVEGNHSTQLSSLWFSMYMISIVKPMVINPQHNLPGVSSVSLLLEPKITTTASNSNDADGSP